MAALFPNIRSLTAALGLTGNNAKTAAGDLDAFKNTTGATDKAPSQQSKSISYQWQKIKATFAAPSSKSGPSRSRHHGALAATLKFLNQMKSGESLARDRPSERRNAPLHALLEYRHGDSKVGGGNDNPLD
jgi:hypothetical protein